MEYISQGQRIIDKINPQTTKEEFESMLGGIPTAADRKLFGATAVDHIAQAILLPAAFAPYPATIDSVEYAAVVDDLMAAQIGIPEDKQDIDTDRIARLLEISAQQGVINMREDGRLYVPDEAYILIRPIFEQY